MRPNKSIFLKAVAGSLLGLSALLGVNNLANRPYEQPVSAESVVKEEKTSSLEELARTGLPEEFQKMGFTMGPYVKRDSSKEIIIIAEKQHDSKDLLKKKKELILYLVKNHGVDSVGMEGFSGEYPKLEGNNCMISPWDEEYVKSLRDPLVEKGLKVNFYGIENRDLTKLLDEASANIFTGCPTKGEVEKVAASLSDLPKGLPKTGIFYKTDGKRDTFKNNYGITLKIRSREFGKNINNALTDSKKTAVIVGGAHSCMPLSEIGNMQDYFQYSYMIIYGPEVKKGIPEFFEIEPYRVDMDKDTFVKELKSLKNL